MSYLVKVGPAEYIDPDHIIAIHPNSNGATIISLRGAFIVISAWGVEAVIDAIRASREVRP